MDRRENNNVGKQAKGANYISDHESGQEGDFEDKSCYSDFNPPINEINVRQSHNTVMTSSPSRTVKKK